MLICVINCRDCADLCRALHPRTGKRDPGGERASASPAPPRASFASRHSAFTTPEPCRPCSGGVLPCAAAVPQAGGLSRRARAADPSSNHRPEND